MQMQQQYHTALTLSTQARWHCAKATASSWLSNSWDELVDAGAVHVSRTLQQLQLFWSSSTMVSNRSSFIWRNICSPLFLHADTVQIGEVSQSNQLGSSRWGKSIYIYYIESSCCCTHYKPLRPLFVVLWQLQPEMYIAKPQPSRCVLQRMSELCWISLWGFSGLVRVEKMSSSQSPGRGAF